MTKGQAVTLLGGYKIGQLKLLDNHQIARQVLCAHPACFLFAKIPL